MKSYALVMVFLTEAHRELVAQNFELIYAPNEGTSADRSNSAAHIAAHADKIRIVLTNGATGITTDEINALPKLEILCTLGVGYETVPVEYLKQRGIRVCNAAGTNEDCVADHAMGLLLSAIRGIPALNNAVRKGVWRDAIPRPPNVSNKRLGLLGMGGIAKKIAKRALAFDMQIGYYSRTRRDETGFEFFPDLLSLATWCDFLVVAAPGGKETFHIINAAVLKALGPQGVLVNIARGSLVNTEALATALQNNVIAAAALDVYESEPKPPLALLEFENAIITPHVAGLSPEAMLASVECFIDNANLHIAGKPLRTPL
ncbi:2-hydroxyacid dehydrogenase [Alcaligenaceae bacterium LF4-65]|uniref:2-hydroxyacid dehydrogenase n=1 Tax=Zwartia hollandica TaxID=324606 RepID=A0A953T2L6_9BURK|nr:2-hydroxyacid dehydrogenase [Zwartia hollandica]MBZ1350510.1 2-hydroxyacid dehydrogenase [Zwartia hollandica]